MYTSYWIITQQLPINDTQIKKGLHVNNIQISTQQTTIITNHTPISKQ